METMLSCLEPSSPLKLASFYAQIHHTAVAAGNKMFITWKHQKCRYEFTKQIFTHLRAKMLEMSEKSSQIFASTTVCVSIAHRGWVWLRVGSLKTKLPQGNNEVTSRAYGKWLTEGDTEMTFEDRCLLRPDSTAAPQVADFLSSHRVEGSTADWSRRPRLTFCSITSDPVLPPPEAKKRLKASVITNLNL